MNTSEVFGPKHHGGSDDPFETIKVLEHWLTPDEMIGFCKGQSIVYQRRHRAKGGLTDLAKSAWYTNYLVKYLASRNLSGLGPTSVLPAKNDGSPKEVPPDQQPVQPAPLPSVSDTAGAVGEPAPSPAPSPETGAGAVADTGASPGAGGSIEDDIADFAKRFAPEKVA